MPSVLDSMDKKHQGGSVLDSMQAAPPSDASKGKTDPISRMEEFINASAAGWASVGSAGAGWMAREISRPQIATFPIPIVKTEAHRKLDVKQAQIWRDYAQLMWDVSNSPDLAMHNEDVFSKAVYMMGRTLPYITTTTAATLTAGPIGAFAAGSMIEGNSAYRTALDEMLELNEGKPLTEAQKRKAESIGIGVGLVSGAVETFGGRLADKLALKAISRIKGKLAKAGATLTVGSLIEALEEGTQEIAHIAGAEAYRDVDWNEMVRRTFGALAGGFFLGGVYRGGSVVMRLSTGELVAQKEGAEQPLAVSRARDIGAVTPESMQAEARETIVQQPQEKGIAGLLEEVAVPPSEGAQLSKGMMEKGEYEALVPKGEDYRGYFEPKAAAEPPVREDKIAKGKRIAQQEKAIEAREQAIVDEGKLEEVLKEGAKEPPVTEIPPSKEPIIPQPTAIIKSEFADWATDYAATRARDLGTPLILQDPEIMKWRGKTLKEVANAQRRFTKSYQAKLNKREHPNIFNPWISARHAFASLGEKTGVPLWHLYDGIMRKGGAANIRGFEEISSRIGLDNLASLSLEDNNQIAEWLYSPEGRVALEGRIKPHALDVAKQLDEILQGPAAKEVQQMVARRWIKSKRPPPDIWNYPTNYIMNKWLSGMKDNTKVSGLVKRLMQGTIPSKANLKTRINRIAKSEGLSPGDVKLITDVLSSQDVQAELKAFKNYPKKILEDAETAKKAGRLAEHIETSTPWTLGLGVRKFYYMSDPAKADIIDDYIDSISLRALDRPQIPDIDRPGTISYEAYARKGKPGVKRGSVVNNVLTHLQRVSIANAVADDMELMYDRLTQKTKDPLTGAEVDRIPLNESDAKTIKNIFNNLLMKREVPASPWSAAAGVKRWFWRTRLSMASRPDAAVWMSFRNALQNIGMGPTAFNIRSVSKAATNYASARASGFSMEQIDPEMYQRFTRDFPSYVSQRRAFYREFLLQDTANISREFGNRKVAQKAAALLERTGNLYGAVDEYVNRMPLWISQYQATKNAALNYKAGRIDLNKFLSQSALNTVRAEQKMLAQDLLDAGKIDDLAAESANWMVEDVNLKYKTSERAGVEQTQAQRIFMGIYTFPRGAMELLAYRGVIPMMKGLETGNYAQMQSGLVNVIKGVAAGELAALILASTVGKKAYDMWSKNRYELLGPGAGTIADLLGVTAETSMRLSNGDMELSQAADKLASTFSRNIDEFLPLAKVLGNVIETHYDTKSINSYNLLIKTTYKKMTGRPLDWKYIRRSDYQKVMHLLIGSFEDPSKPRPQWDKSFGIPELNFKLSLD